MRLSEQIESYIDYCKNVKRLTPISIKTKTYCLKRFARDTGCRSLRFLDNSVLEGWIGSLTKTGVCARTVNSYLIHVKLLVKFYRDMGEKIPLRMSRIPQLSETDNPKVWFTREQIEAVASKQSLLVELIILIMFDTGMRITELSNLRISSFDGRKVTYFGKCQKWHIAYIRPKTLEKLNKYLDEYIVNDYLWAEPNKDHPMKTQTIRKYLNKAFYNSGYNMFYPHSLRHSFATYLQNQGASIEEIQVMIGHANVAVTQRYLHGLESNMQKLFDKYA